jgi:hypothetical protein
MKKRTSKRIKAKDFDAAFDEGEVTRYLDLRSVKVHYPKQVRLAKHKQLHKRHE